MVTVSEDEIGHCPSLLTAALTPECEPGIQPRRLGGVSLTLAPQPRGIRAGESGSPCSPLWMEPLWKGWFLRKASAQTEKLPNCSKTALFVFWCRWWCQHSSGSSRNFLLWWHFGKAKVQSRFFNKHFLAKQHFFFFFNEICFCCSSVL